MSPHVDIVALQLALKTGAHPRLTRLSREDKQRWIESFLVQCGYGDLDREGRGVVRSYIQAVTGYSRAQMARYIASFSPKPVTPATTVADTSPSPDPIPDPVGAPYAAQRNVFHTVVPPVALLSLLVIAIGLAPSRSPLAFLNAERTVTAVPDEAPREIAVVTVAPDGRTNELFVMAETESAPASPTRTVVAAWNASALRQRVEARRETRLHRLLGGRDEHVVESPASPAVQSLFDALSVGKEGQVLMMKNGKIVWAHPNFSGTGRAPLPEGATERPSRGGSGGGGSGESSGTSTNTTTTITVDSDEWTDATGIVYLTDTTLDVGIGTTTPKAKLDVVGTLSGTALTISALQNCDTIDTDANGNLICGTDNSVGTGLSQSGGDERYVNQSGDTMTGALVIDLQGTTTGVGLEVIETISGSTLFANISLRSSGSLVWEGSASGASLYIASSIQGAGLADCDLATQTLQWDATTGRFSCGTDSDTTYSAGQNLTLNGTSFSLNSTITGALVRFNTVSGSTIYAMNSLASSGSLAIDGTAFLNSSSPLKLTNAGFFGCTALETDADGDIVCGSDGGTTYSAGQGLSLNGSNAFSVNTTLTGALAEFTTLSGSTVYASASLRSSGSVVWEGTASGASIAIMAGTDSYFLGDLAIGKTSADEKLEVDGNVLITYDSGNSFKIGRSGIADTFAYITAVGPAFSTAGFMFQTQYGGDSTNAVSITTDIATGQNVLEVLGLGSGRTLYAQQSLRSSGSLVWEGAASGSSLYVATSIQGAGLADCDLATQTLQWDATTGRFSCGTDSDTTYSAGQNLTLNGTSFSLNSTITGALVRFNTVSGSLIYAKNTLASSGSLVWEGAASGATLYIASSLQGAGLADCDIAGTSKLLWDATTGRFSCGTDSGTTYTAGQGLTLTSTAFSLADTISGALLEFQTVSGSTVYASKSLRSSGSLVWEDAASGATLYVATSINGAGLTDCDAATSTLAWDATTGRFSCGTDSDTTYSAGQGLTLNGTSFSLNSTITGALVRFNTVSGSLIYAKNTLASSGSLVWEGAASGASLYVASSLQGAGLADCDLSTSVLRWDESTGRFSCGTISASNWSGTGALQTAFDSRYVNTSGDTMTGVLAINVTGGNINTVGLEVINTISGSIVHANTLLRSSGSLVVEGTGVIHGNIGVNTGSLAGVAFYAMASDANEKTAIFRVAAASNVNNVEFIDRSGFTSAWIDGSGVIRGSKLELDTLSDAGTKLQFIYNNATNVGYITSARTSGPTARSLIFAVNNGTSESEALRIYHDGNVGIGSTAPKAKLDVVGTVSGITLYANQALRSSGSLVWEGAASGATLYIASSLQGAGLADCDIAGTSKLLWDATTGRFSCGTDGGGTSYTAGQGLTLTSTAFSLADTISGALLEFQTVSGSIVHANTLLRSSGSLVTESGAYFDGTTMVIQAGSNRVGIGTASPKTALEVIGTISGSLITQNGGGDNYFMGNVGIGTTDPGITAGAFPTLTMEGVDTNPFYELSRLSDSLSDGNGIGAIKWHAGTARNGIAGVSAVVVGTSENAGSLLFTTANGAGTVERVRIDNTGNVGIGASAPENKLEVAGSISGATLYITSSMSGAGLTDCDLATQTLNWDATTGRFSCGTDSGTTYTAGQGLTLTSTAFSLSDTVSGALLEFQTVSGSTVYASKSLRSSGSLVWEGAASGASLYVASSLQGAGLADCDLSTSALRWDATTGRFSCGTISASNWSGTGALQTAFDGRYVRTAGGTMTGALTINLSSGTIGLNVLQTMSGHTVFASKKLVSSGSLVTESGAYIAGTSLVVQANNGYVGIGTAKPSAPLTVSGSSPEFRLYAGDYSRILRTSTENEVAWYNRVLAPSTPLVGVAFNGAASQYTISNTDATAASAITLSFWVKRDASATTKGLMQWANSLSSGNPFVYLRDASGTLTWYVNGGFNLAGGSLTNDAWTHLALTWDGSVWRSYKNGAEVTAYSGGATFQANATQLYFGQGYDGYWTGSMDEIRAYNDDLSAGTIQDHYNSGIGTYGSAGESSIIGGWHLDENTGSSAEDFTASGDDATLTNGVTWVTGVVGAGSNVEGAILSMKDGVTSGELGILTLGDTLARTIIKGNVVIFDTGGAEKMRLTTDGKLGIGTSSPDAELEVIGTASGRVLYAKNSLRSSGSLVWEGAASGASLYVATSIQGAGLSDCDAATSALQWDATTGRFSCDTTAGNTYTAGQGLTLTSSAFSLSSSISGSLLEFQTVSGSIVHANTLLRSSGSLVTESGAYIDGTTFVVQAGSNRVGIGTANPTAQLHLLGSAGTSLMISGGTGNNSGTILFNGNGLANNTWMRQQFEYNSSDLRFDRSSDGGTAWSNIMTLDWLGSNVGIGTIAPKSKLDVVGTISGSLITQNGAGNNSFMGNVGIGTTSPARPLHVHSATPYLRLQDTADGTQTAAWVEFYGNTDGRHGFLGFGSESNDDLYINNDLAGLLRLRTSNTDRMTIDSNGLVGIGTTAPSALLDVKEGNIRISTGSLLVTPGTPVVMGSTATDATNTQAPQGVAVQGRYAYITSATSDSLSIIDISVPGTPVRVSTLINSTLLDSAKGVVVSGKYAYVSGTVSDAIAVIDISNPTAPVVVGSVKNASVLNGAGDIFLVGEFLYIACEAGNRVAVVSVANPLKPTIVSFTTADTTNTNDARKIVVQGKYAYVASRLGTGDLTANTTMTIFDISNPKNLVRVSSTTSANLSDARGIYVSGKYAYVTGLASDSVVIFDISNPAAPSEVGSLASTSRLDGATGIVVAGKYAYVGAATDDMLTVVDVSNPALPFIQSFVTSTTQLDNLQQIVLAGRYVYTVNNIDDLFTVVDIGSEIPSLYAGTLGASLLTVEDDAKFNNTVSIGNGLNVGNGGIQSNGSLSILTGSGGLGMTGAVIRSHGGSGALLALDSYAQTAIAPHIVFGFQGSFDTNLYRSATATLKTDGSLFVRNTISGSLITQNGAGSNYFMGNLGIGETSPDTLFHIKSAADPTMTFENTDTTINAANLYGALSFVGNDASSNASGTRAKIEAYSEDNAGSTSLRLFTTNAGSVAFNTGVVIKQTGNVGIGTTGPKAKLDVIGTVSGSLITQNGAGNNYFIGNVGFGGVTSAGSPLDIRSNSSNEAINIQTNGSTSAFILFQDNTTDEWHMGRTEGDNSFGISETGVNDHFRILPGGNIGIGTITPQSKLQVTGGGLCVGSDANCNTDNNTEGVVYSSSTAMSVYDVAEMYPTTDLTLTGADIVSLDPANGVFVKRAAPGDKRLLGVVSAEPAVVLGGFNGQQFQDDHQVAIALSGRVPVRVTLEGGPIAIGDSLTLGSQAGIARKAKGGEQTIGYALEGFSGPGTGSILVFVRTGDVQPMAISESGAGLAVTSTSISGKALMLLDTEETDGTKDALKIVTDVGTNENTVFRIAADGDVHTDGTYNSSGADYAEWFKTAGNAKLESGVLVCVDPTQPNTVKLCDRDADSNVMGIVSTNPAFIGNSIGGASGIIPPGYSLIGLIGQVPAKVTAEGGPIRPGDQLTSASKPGYARKAAAGESTVGVALEGLENGEGTVNVLISRRNSSLTVETVEDHVLETIAAMEIEDEVEIMIATAMGDLNVEQSIIDEVTAQVDALNVPSAVEAEVARQIAILREDLLALASNGGAQSGTGAANGGSDLTASTLWLTQSLSVDGDARIAGDLHLDGTLLTNDLFVPGILAVDGSLTSSTLNVTGDAAVHGALTLHGPVIFGSGAAIQFGSGFTMVDLIVERSLTVLGDITIDGLATFLGDVAVEGELTVARQAGHLKVPLGATGATFAFEPPFKGTPVVTASPNKPVLYAVSVATSTGFTVSLAAPAEADITFSWVALIIPSQNAVLEDAPRGLQFPVDETGMPVSSSLQWNACIRGLPLFDASGIPYSCSRYHDGNIWQHPDLNISFVWNDAVTPPYMQLPDGYVATVTENSASVRAAILEVNGIQQPAEEETETEAEAETETADTPTEEGETPTESEPPTEETPPAEEIPAETPPAETPAEEAEIEAEGEATEEIPVEDQTPVTEEVPAEEAPPQEPVETVPTVE